VPGNFVSFSQSPGRFFLYMLFPALSVALSRVAMTVKMLRSSILDEMNKDYIRTAFSRGRTRAEALRRHALRNALIPVIAFLAVTAAELVAGTIVVEQVFAVPGVGRLLLASISTRDFPVAQAIVVLLAAWVVIVNFIADILYQYMDPRIRIQ
ncbi:MAG: ABC transporter permease, partial [Evtepia sp.]